MFVHEFSRSSALAVLLALGAPLLVACERGDDARPLVVDTSSGALAERDPRATATGGAARLTDANLFAVLDTSYAMIVTADSIAQSHARDRRVREFARNAMSQNARARRGIRTTADRLDIAPAPSDPYVIRDRVSSLATLRGDGDDDFERDYLERVVGSRRAMVNEIDQALARQGNQRDAVRELLRDLRSSLDADRRQAEAIRVAASRK